MNRLILLTLVFMLPAIGFSEDIDLKETRTVSWFEANQSERDRAIKICTDNPGELRDNPNCINAHQASNRHYWTNKNSINVAPLTFDKPK
jgi:hypothetical protein